MTILHIGAGDHSVEEDIHIHIPQQLAQHQGEDGSRVTADETLLGVTLAGFAVFPILGDGVEAILDGQTKKFVSHTFDDLGATAIAHRHEEVYQSQRAETA